TPIDTADTSTVARDQPASPSNIQITGKTILVQGQVLAPGGNITLDAADPDNPAGATSTSRIYVDSGATISAAGMWVPEPASANVIKIDITSNELKDAPLLRNGPLQGESVFVDIKRGTPLFDITPFVNGQQQTAKQKAEVGGTITLRSQGD